jgi:hypothetical protein
VGGEEVQNAEHWDSEKFGVRKAYTDAKQKLLVEIKRIVWNFACPFEQFYSEGVEYRVNIF